MKVNSKVCLYNLDPSFVDLLQAEVEKAAVKTGQAVTLNFRDTGTSIVYITDFAFGGTGAFAELAKEIDFDFGLRRFQHFGKEYPLGLGAELFSVWQENFLTYPFIIC